MTDLEIIQGSAADWPLQCWLQGGQAAASFASDDAMTAYVYPGGSEAATITPAVAWYTDGGNQTGHDQGQITVSITSAQSAGLERGGAYQLLVWWSPASDPSKKACVWRGGLTVLPASGTDTQTVVPYCTLADVLRIAPWCRLVANADTQEEGFYRERLQAREWLDWAVLNCYRGAYAGNFGEISSIAFSFGGGAGLWRSAGPSPTLVDYLAADKLIRRPQIVLASAYKTASIIGLGQVGTNNQYAAYGAYFRDMADRTLTATTAEIDLDGDGIAEICVSLGSTNTLFT